MATNKEAEPGVVLVNMFCHTFKANGTYQYQGRVQEFLGDGFYLVQLFSAFDGAPTFAQVVTINDMRTGGWRFYKHEEVWRQNANEMLEEMSMDDYTPPGTPPTLGLN